MFLRTLPVLGILLLAACTSSEPQNASPVRLAPGAGTVSAALLPHDQTAHPMQDAAGASVLQPDPNCRVVGDATLCDATPDPDAEDRPYTN